jgi:hypothetical protein
MEEKPGIGGGSLQVGEVGVMPHSLQLFVLLLAVVSYTLRERLSTYGCL